MTRKLLLIFILVLFLLSACTSPAPPIEGTYYPPETTPTQAPTEPTEPPTEPTEPPTEPPEGWQEEGGQKLYYENGVPLTGWQALEGLTYYFRPDGTMAQGKVEIDGVNHFFSTAGQEFIFVNPWNLLPEGYEPELVELPSSLSTSGGKVDKSCYDALVAMLTDCNKESPKACVVSTYRTYDYQVNLFNKKVNYYLNLGYDRAEAEKEAATIIAIPGTSEHHTGLAVDIVDTRSWSLDEGQEDLPAQQWLMENSWKYGFILRYPTNKSEITGIIYEPWHYRYVGTEIAAELHATGQTLEEYVDSLTK